MEITSELVILSFLMAALLVGTVAKHLVKYIDFPYTVVLLIIGLLGGLVERLYFAGEVGAASAAINVVANIEAGFILYFFLPVLIFESAFALNVQLFNRLLPQVVTLAVPGLLICSLATAFFVDNFLPLGWNWSTCLLFGALISATDPVAVVALFKETSSKKSLGTLIEGESLLNDGTAIVLFTIFLAAVSAGGDGGAQLSFFSAFVRFMVVICIGVGIGVAIGYASMKWIGTVNNDPMIEISITIISAYLSFFISEFYFHASGIMSVVTVALVSSKMGQSRISPEVADFLHKFWEALAFVANTLIFLLVGLTIAHRLPLFPVEYWVMLVALFLALTVIRAGAIFILFPILKNTSIGISKEKTFVLTWSGLRGVVAVALALVISQNKDIPVSISDEILFFTAGIVILTILINGTTMGWLMSILKLDRLSPGKALILKNASAAIGRGTDDLVKDLEGNLFLQYVNWHEVKQKAPLKLGMEVEEEINTEVTFQAKLTSCCKRLLESEKRSYWRQFSKGLLGETAVKSLVRSVDLAMLSNSPIVGQRDSIYKYLNLPVSYELLSKLPVFSKFAPQIAFNNFSNAYDIARGFITAQEFLEEELSSITDDPMVKRELREQIVNNKKNALLMVGKLRNIFPEVLESIETNITICVMLNYQKEEVSKLVDSHILGESEGDILKHNISSKLLAQKKFKAKPVRLDSTQLLRRLPWLQEADDTLIVELAGMFIQKFYPAGANIVNHGDEVNSLMMVLRGVVELVDIQDGKEHLYDVLSPGSIHGNLSMSSTKSEFGIRACSPADIAWLPSEQFMLIIAKEPRITMWLSDWLSERSIKDK